MGSKERRTSNSKGIRIVRVAAFCFAIVSWKATAEGLSSYVFNNGWEAGIISFAIQSILFVFNLQLPYYFLVFNRGEHKTRFSVMQVVICLFYVVILFSSSFFSFIYICNTVVYEHQSGYVDDHVVLMTEEMKIYNSLEEYIAESEKLKILQATDLLTELIDKYPENEDQKNASSLDELQRQLNEAQSDYDTVELELKTLDKDIAQYEKLINDYTEQALKTRNHEMQRMWEEKRQKAVDAYETAKEDREEKIKEMNAKKKALEAAKAEIQNYRKPEKSILTDLLIEMLNKEPALGQIHLYLSELNETLIELDEKTITAEGYKDLVLDSKNLTVLIEDYETLSELDLMLEKSEKTDSTSDVIPDPNQDSFEEDYLRWRTTWRERLDNLESILQKIPTRTNAWNGGLVSVVDLDKITSFSKESLIEQINDLKRSKVSDINAIEKATSLLTGKYKFMAWFSLAVALLFDLSSLLGGLFLYGISPKHYAEEKNTQREGDTNPAVGFAA